MQTPSSNADGLPDGVAVRPLAESARIDTAALASELSAHGFRLDGDFVPRQFAGGLANLNFLIRLETGFYVLRRPPDGPLPAGANDMAREHRILSNLWKALPLAPRSLHFCSDTSLIGAPFQILEFREGAVIRGDRLAPSPETAETAKILSDKLIETLAKVHAVDPASVGLQELGRPEGFFVRQVKGWTRRAEDVLGGELPPAARELTAWLAAAPAPDEGAPVLLHSDFKLDNLLIDLPTLEPTTLVDWDMGTRGSAAYDVATLLSYWTEAGDPDCMHRLAQMPTALPGFATREEAAARYAALTGRPLDDLQPFRVMTLLKLAVVFLQLHRRHVTGETSDPRYATFGELGTDLLDFALDVARGRIF